MPAFPVISVRRLSDLAGNECKAIPLKINSFVYRDTEIPPHDGSCQNPFGGIFAPFRGAFTVGVLGWGLDSSMGRDYRLDYLDMIYYLIGAEGLGVLSDKISIPKKRQGGVETQKTVAFTALFVVIRPCCRHLHLN
jgi:hypothetical protein